MYTYVYSNMKCSDGRGVFPEVFREPKENKVIVEKFLMIKKWF